MPAELYFPLTNPLNRNINTQDKTGLLGIQVGNHKFYYMNFEKDPNEDVMKKMSPGGIRGYVIETILANRSYLQRNR
jgi:hypothetical protein